MASNSVASAIGKVKAKGTAQRVFGWIIAVFNGFIALIGCGASGFWEPIDVVMVLIFAACAAAGVWLIVLGNKKFKLIKTFYDYSARLAADPEKSIDFLASATGVTVAAATKNLGDMLALGFFPNCYLDAQRNRLVMPSAAQPHSASSAPTAAAAHTVKYITVQCKGCGAVNQIVAGTVGECEYCGSKISE
ncbi:MAG: hypothetical protein ACI4IV_07595 [Acutalibacteraceae bacterium]